MRVVLDTNVLVAAILGEVRHSNLPPAEIWRRWQAIQFQLITSEHILRELGQALGQPWFTQRLPVSRVAHTMELLAQNATVVEITTFVSGVASHEEDDLVLSAAVSGNADYLVTGDIEFRQVDEYQRVKIRTPTEFLRELDALSIID